MHQLQEKLLKKIWEGNLSGLTLRGIGELIGEKSAQKVKHHLMQLSKKGFIIYNAAERKIKLAQVSKEGFVSLPIVGSANCGPATIFAAGNINGYLKVSKKLVPRGGKLFVLRAEGDSMNRADIKDGKNIEDGDFVVIDSEQKSPESGQYIVSVIDEVANIKKFVPDPQNKRIILKSESTKDYFPIFIHEDDRFHISGRVIDVIKK